MPSEASAAAGVVRRATRDATVRSSAVATTDIGFAPPQAPAGVARESRPGLTQRPAGRIRQRSPASQHGYPTLGAGASRHSEDAKGSNSPAIYTSRKTRISNPAFSAS